MIINMRYIGEMVPKEIKIVSLRLIQNKCTGEVTEDRILALNNARKKKRTK